VSDVVIIGGGIVGSSVAYHAARAGLSVSLVDRGDEGHATAAGAGIIAPGAGHREPDAHNSLVAHAGAYYPRLLARLAEDGEAETGYSRVGSVLIATNESEAAALDEARRFAAERLASGVQGVEQVSVLDGKTAQSLFPALADVPAALHISGTARIDGRLMRDALQRAAQRHGASIECGEATVSRNADGAVQVSFDGKTLPAGSVVIATGAWTAALGETLGVPLPVFPQRGQIAHLALPDQDTSEWPVVLTFQGHYLLTFPRDRVVVGATREDESGFDYRQTAGGVRQVLDQALRVAPGLHGATACRWWDESRGCRTSSLPRGTAQLD
jgi:D-amino-acid dehydrogenase